MLVPVVPISSNILARQLQRSFSLRYAQHLISGLIDLWHRVFDVLQYYGP